MTDLYVQPFSAPSLMRISWYLEFAKPPATAEVQRGPIPFDLLVEKLVLDEDTVSLYHPLPARISSGLSCFLERTGAA